MCKNSYSEVVIIQLVAIDTNKQCLRENTARLCKERTSLTNAHHKQKVTCTTHTTTNFGI